MTPEKTVSAGPVMVVELPIAIVSGPPVVSTSTVAPTSPSRWAIAADAVAPVPQERVSPSTPRSNVRMRMAPGPVTWPGAGTVTPDNESNGVSRAFFAPTPISGRDGRPPQSGGA